jgi:hypothetical protein
VVRACRDGVIHSFKIGRRIIIPVTEVARLLALAEEPVRGAERRRRAD